MNAPDLPDDGTVRFALAWLALYFMLIAGGLAGERDGLLRQPERLPHTVSMPMR